MPACSFMRSQSAGAKAIFRKSWGAKAEGQNKIPPAWSTLKRRYKKEVTDLCSSFTCFNAQLVQHLQLRHPRYITSRYLRTMPRNCSSLEAPLLKLSDLRNAVLRTHLRSHKPAKIFLHFLPAIYFWGMKTEVDQTLQLDVFLRA